MIYSVENVIVWAKITQALALRDIQVNKATGKNHSEERLPEILYESRTSLEWAVSHNASATSIDKVSNYVYSLCTKYLPIAKRLANLGGGIVSGVVTSAAAQIRGFRNEIRVGEGSLSAGDTEYIIAFPYIVENTVMVETPQSNVPLGETDQFSYSIVYTNENATIRFTNFDEDGVTNLGLPEGMLLIISGLRLASSATAASSGTTVIGASQPRDRQFTGADIDEDGNYIHSDYIGYHVIVSMKGYGDLEPELIEELPTVGGAKILIGLTYSADDKFTIRSNGSI